MKILQRVCCLLVSSMAEDTCSASCAPPNTPPIPVHLSTFRVGVILPL